MRRVCVQVLTRRPPAVRSITRRGCPSRAGAKLRLTDLYLFRLWLMSR